MCQKLIEVAQYVINSRFKSIDQKNLLTFIIDSFTNTVRFFGDTVNQAWKNYNCNWQNCY